MNHVLLTKQPLDVEKINSLVADHSCGAISLFVGTTRNNYNNNTVVLLEYEAYESMALKEIHLICAQLRSRWEDLCHIAIYHRLGTVSVGESSIVIAISSPHRESSLAAVALAIGEVKKRVPIWKREKYESDLFEWKENKECHWLKNDNKITKNDFTSKLQAVCEIPTSLIQINVKDDEVSRRIQSFIDKKREEVNAIVENDFVTLTQSAEPTNSTNQNINFRNSCARTYKYIFKRESSSGHLRVTRAKNTYGPQIKPKYIHEFEKFMDKRNTKNLQQKLFSSNNYFHDRMDNIEKYLKLTCRENLNIFERLKAVEDRILYLESMSPEYKHFLTHLDGDGVTTTMNPKRKQYTISDLEERINALTKNC